MSDSGRTNLVQVAFGYNPCKAAALTAGAVYVIVSISLFIRLIRRRNWWGICLPIGTIAYAAGFFLRYDFVLNPFSVGILIGTQLLIVVSPAAFVAFNYIVYGRLMRAFAGDRPEYSLIRPQRVARVLVISDVVTLNIQVQVPAPAWRLMKKLANLGRIIVLIGIIAQLGSYVFFIVIMNHSHRHIAKDVRYTKQNFPWQIFHLLYFSSAFILIRGIYRTIELAQGQKGSLSTHEIYLYMLDTLPLLFATAIYVPFWPGKYFDVYTSRREGDYLMEAIDSA